MDWMSLIEQALPLLALVGGGGVLGGAAKYIVHLKNAKKATESADRIIGVLINEIENHSSDSEEGKKLKSAIRNKMFSEDILDQDKLTSMVDSLTKGR